MMMIGATVVTELSSYDWCVTLAPIHLLSMSEVACKSKLVLA